MVYNIVQDHGGYVDVYSEEGVGSTFKLYLPVAGNNSVRIDDNSLSEIPKGSGTVLVINDEEIMRKIAEEILGV